MAWKVTWTLSAWNDLDAAAEYIARDSINYAASFVYEVRSASLSLQEFARIGRVVPETSNNNIRELLIGNFRLIYKIKTNEIFILALVHGARNIIKLSDFKKRILKPTL